MLLDIMCITREWQMSIGRGPATLTGESVWESAGPDQACAYIPENVSV